MSRVTVIFVVVVVVAVALGFSQAMAQRYYGQSIAIATRPDEDIGCELSIDDAPDMDYSSSGIYSWNFHTIIPRDAFDEYHKALLRWNKYESPEDYLDRNLDRLCAKVGNCLTTALKTCVMRRTQQCYSRITIEFGPDSEFSTAITSALERKITGEGYIVERRPILGSYGETLKVTVYNNNA